ncbi:MAG: hypothetical protein V1767_09640 [Chloroflexota bacterium]
MPKKFRKSKIKRKITFTKEVSQLEQTAKPADKSAAMSAELPKRYSYVRKELRNIFINAGIVLLVLFVMYFLFR